MKWPFVSRAQYEHITGYHQAVADHLREICAKQAAEARADIATERQRYDALLEKHSVLTEKYVTLKMAGAVEPTPLAPISELAAAQPDELHDLVHERFGANPRVLRGALAQLAKDRKAGKSDDDIASAILIGYSPDGVPQ